MRTGKPALMKGSVLILALWVLFSLAALTIATASHVMTLLSASERLGQRVQARAQGWSGAAMAAAVIDGEMDKYQEPITNKFSDVSTNAVSRWDGLQQQAFNREGDQFEFKYSLGGRDAIIKIGFETVGPSERTVTNEGVLGVESRVNLNTASSNLLTALIMKVTEFGRPDAEAQTVAILQRRSDGDDMLTAGTGNHYYSQENAASTDVQGPLRSVEALLLIPGVDVGLLNRLGPYVTVYGSGKININAASEVVLEALGDSSIGPEQFSGGDSKSLADKIVRFREAGNTFERAVYVEMRTALDQFEPLTPGEGTVFTAMAAQLDVRSEAFGGTVYVEDDVGPRKGEGARGLVDFVWDVQVRKFVMWRERFSGRLRR